MKLQALRQAELIRQLKNARQSAGLTQEELAKRLESDQSIVAKIESGIRRIDVLEFAEICDALGVSPGEIILAARNTAVDEPVAGCVRAGNPSSKYANFE